ncbi:MAG: Hpt domain-containing protein [Sneathiella sp.]
MLAHPTLDDIPIGDLDFLKHLASLSGASIARKLLMSAPEAVEKEISLIKISIENNDSDELKNACHALRGACYSVQVRRLADMARKIENVASNIPKAKELLPDLELICSETFAWWEKVLDEDLI